MIVIKKYLIRRVEKKLSEVHSEEILLLGDDQTVLQSMKKLIEENFEHEVFNCKRN